MAVAFIDGYIDVFRPLEGKKKNNVPYYGLLTLARDWKFRINGFPADSADVFGPDFNCQAVKIHVWKAIEREIDNGRLELVQWTAGHFLFSLYLYGNANCCLEELCFVPGTADYNSVPLIVDTNGKVCWQVLDTVLGERRQGDGEDIFSASDWEMHGFQDTAALDASTFLGYQVGNGSIHTPDVRIVDADEDCSWLKSAFNRQDDIEDDILLAGQDSHPYIKPPAPKTSGLFIKTAPRGELGSQVYQYMKVGSSASVPIHSSKPHPILPYPASISAPNLKSGVVLPASTCLIRTKDQQQSHSFYLQNHRTSAPHIADSNFSMHSSLHTHSNAASSHAGSSKFPGAYVEDNRVAKKIRKF